MTTPAKSPAEKRQICTCGTGRCRGPQGLNVGWVCAMEAEALRIVALFKAKYGVSGEWHSRQLCDKIVPLIESEYAETFKVAREAIQKSADLIPILIEAHYRGSEGKLYDAVKDAKELIPQLRTALESL